MNIQKNYIENIFKTKKQDALTSRHKKIINLIDKLDGSKAKRILDVGIWDGSILRNISLPCDKFALDISDNQTHFLKQNGIALSVIDFENDKFPYENSYFDVVLLNEVIEHVINTDNLIGEINRVLRVGGILIISFPNVNYFIGILMQVFFDWTPAFSSRYKAVHVRDWTLKVIKRMLAINGFSYQRVIGHRFSSDIIMLCQKKYEPDGDVDKFYDNISDLIGGQSGL
jgi:SAM-dependent methyltransferase